VPPASADCQEPQVALQMMAGRPDGSRVEKWRSGVGWAYPLAGSFDRRCLTSPTLLCLHIPLIEPDVRVSRIRLSDTASCVRPPEAARAEGDHRSRRGAGWGSVQCPDPAACACGAANRRSRAV